MFREIARCFEPFYCCVVNTSEISQRTSDILDLKADGPFFPKAERL